EGLFDTITPEHLSNNAELYVEQIRQMREWYDAIIDRPRNKFAAVVERYGDNIETTAVTLLKYVLASVGLVLKSQRVQWRKKGEGVVSAYSYYIENAQEAYDVMLWRERGRTKNPDLDHIASTFGAPKDMLL